MGADVVEEVTVVTHHEHGVFKAGEEVFQPANSFHIEIVRRFVHQQHIGVTEEALGQQHAYLLVTAEFFHRAFMQFFCYTEVAENGGGIAFGVPAVHFGKLTFEFACADAIFVGKIGFGIQRVFFLHDAPKLLMAAENGLQYRNFIEFEVVLL